MKIKLILIGICVMLCHFSFAQFICGGVQGSILKSSGIILKSDNYIPDNNTSTKYIRVNCHFILQEEGTAWYPENFTANDDGNGNTGYTGYDYANDLINLANYRLNKGNEAMFLPPGNSTEVLETKFRFVLNSVFFHEDNTYHYWGADTWLADVSYGVDRGHAINVYFVHSTATGQPGGHANMNDERYVKFNYAWERYISDLSLPLANRFGLAIKAGGLIHEVGHNFSLHHTMMNDFTGNCDPNHDDNCTDTPTMGEIQNTYGFDPCNNIWNCSSDCSNNVMDYSGHLAFTPEQLRRVHWTIENEMSEYLNCYVPSGTIALCDDDFIRQNIFSENVTIGDAGCGGSIIMESDKNTRILISNSSTINNFQVEKGASFSIDVNCN